MASLGELRAQLDQVDDEIVRLYEERMKLCEAVGEYKVRTGSKVFDRQREREKLAGRMKQVENDLHVWENNIGFFSKSGKTNEVVKEFEKKIEGARHKLALMQEKLRIIDGML